MLESKEHGRRHGIKGDSFMNTPNVVSLLRNSMVSQVGFWRGKSQRHYAVHNGSRRDLTFL